MISVYFHIPFCTKKCPYCHFYVIPNRPAYQTLLSASIALEWEQKRPLWKGKEITSVYFGGGTPSLFEKIGEILEKIPRDEDCEITIEANPEESSFELFSHFVNIGINRLSLGVQSFDDASLDVLGRLHSAKKAEKAIEEAHRAGFKNISIDLMYDLPNQTEESWERTLYVLKDLPIQHLSLYNLTIEPHTSFYARRVKTPPGELSLKFLTRALETFQEIGLQRYEISAFARAGFESRHNLGYWTGRPFLGFGPSAFSYWEGERFRNVANIHRYARHLKEGSSPVDFREKLCPSAHTNELLAIHLRVLSGVDIGAFVLPDETKKAIETLSREGFLVFNESKNRLQLTEKGMLYYDSVAVELI